MLKFKAFNVNGDCREWSFPSIVELREELKSEDCDLPAEEDIMVSVELFGVPIYGLKTFGDVLASLEL